MPFRTPYALEVSIDNVGKILETFPPEQANFNLAISESPDVIRAYIIQYCLFPADGARRLPIANHSLGKTCAEMMISTEIQRRFCVLLRDVILDVEEAYREQKYIIYDSATGVRLLRVEYVSELFSLNSLSFRYEDLLDGIEVLSVSLQSPFRIRSKIVNAITALQLAIGPAVAPTPEIAAQQAMVRAANIGNAINAATAIVNAAEVGFKLSVQWRTDGQAERLRYEIETDNYLNLQIVLAQRGRYSGSIDGIYGPKTEAALRSFALSVGLPADTAKTDMRLLEALLEGIELPPSAASR